MQWFCKPVAKIWIWKIWSMLCDIKVDFKPLPYSFTCINLMESFRYYENCSDRCVEYRTKVNWKCVERSKCSTNYLSPSCHSGMSISCIKDARAHKKCYTTTEAMAWHAPSSFTDISDQQIKMYFLWNSSRYILLYFLP